LCYVVYCSITYRFIFFLFQDIYELETLYSSVDDIDFIVGALLETPENDSLVGNTSRCIISDFFYRSRVGDRFFYDNNGQSGQFSKSKQFILYLSSTYDTFYT